MNFLEIYDTLNNLLEAEDVQQSLSKSAKIKYYYNNALDEDHQY